MTDIFAPEGGWRVRILDLSGGAEEGISEEIPGFPTLMQANAFARRYVCDSIERCRTQSASPGEILSLWHSFGEDAEVLDAGNDAWQSATELSAFAERPASDEERDWRALDPRRADDDPDED